jgi:hypothetical protein
MDWIQFFGFILTIGGLFLWNRSESRADLRHLETSTTALIEAIRQDMKDFHGRLERQDAEFKGAFLLLEEKIRNK